MERSSSFSFTEGSKPEMRAARSSGGVLISLEAGGKFGHHVIAFARKYGQQWAAVIAPRFLSRLVQEGDFPLGRQVWQDTEVVMPDGAPAQWRNVITDEVLAVGKALPVGEVLRRG